MIDAIYINPDEMPACECGHFEWDCHQRIERQAKLLKIDRLGDLVTDTPDPNLYQQSIVLKCTSCGATYQPQSGVWAAPRQDSNYQGIPYGKPVVEAYSEGTQTTDEEGNLKEKISGFEDSYNFPGKVGNDVQYSEDSWEGLL